MFVRILRFLLVSAAAGAIIVYGIPLSTLKTPPVATQVHEVSAKDLQITCSGPILVAGGKNQTSISTFKRLASAAGSLSYSGADQTSLKGYSKNPVRGFGIRQDLFKRIDKFTSFNVLDKSGKNDQGSALLTVNQIQFSKDKSIRGLLAAPCLRPQSEFWLVGGSTAIGREALLVLTNPTPIDSSVDLQIFTENGNSTSAGLSGIAVPANKATIVPLSSFVLRAESVAVHVVSRGGSITALIQQKAVRGNSASGADYISPAPAASKRAVLPGILVRGSKDSSKLRAKADKYSDVQQLLRVFVPGTKDATLTFQVLGTTEDTFGTVLSVTASAGKVTDFEIPGLADGDYFGILDSDVKVHSSVRLVRTKIKPETYTDFAWINPAEAFSTPRFVAVPRSGISKLSVTNPGDKPTTVKIRIGGVTVKRTITAGATDVILAAPGLSMGVIPEGQEVHANLVVDVDGRVAVLPLLDDKNISGLVEVSVH
jgi:hypothetical protein